MRRPQRKITPAQKRIIEAKRRAMIIARYRKAFREKSLRQQRTNPRRRRR